ncbi:MAG: glycosyltransferase family 4 protein [Alphaproteobacteria bacterium]|nr:glycosyltransferase family 4 protein [Alphaproteobacteria bacterium]MBV8549106.1 glycosyltransferase family 4 protein [Alphaproteobacteria bacterium]
MTMQDLLPLIAILSSLGVTLMLTGYVRGVLLKHKILDQPNARSSHTIAVPRGGGWAFLPTLIAALLAPLAITAIAPMHPYLLTGLILLALISWVDDRFDISARIRLCLHFAAVIVALCDLPNHGLIFAGMIPAWIDHILVVVGWVWFINLYNFMDGIDGITGVETISLAVGLCLLGDATGVLSTSDHTIFLLLIGGCLGFLAYNWHPAKIFMGDIGSIPLGFLTGFGLLSLASNGHLVAAIILPLYYLADSGITIAKRALRREKIWQAHRQHFYQRATTGCGRHDNVTMRIAAANLFLIVLSVWSLNQPFGALLAALIVVALLLFWMHTKSKQQAAST